MHLRRALVMFAAALLLSGELEHANAQSHINIENSLDPSPIASTYTQVGGWTTSHSAGGSYTCATGTNNTYTISGSPTLYVSDSVSPDVVRFHSATITANNNVCGHIYFWAKFLPDPSGTVDFDLSSYGQIKNKNGGSTSGSWVHISGWLQHYSDGTLPGLADGIQGSWEHIGSTSGPPVSAPPQDKHGSALGAATISLTTDENPDLSGITNPRIMKGEIWFYLNQNHQLILNTNGVTVQTAAGGGGDGECGRVPCNIRDAIEEIMGDLNVPNRLDRLEKNLKLPPLKPDLSPCTGPAEKCPPVEKQ